MKFLYQDWVVSPIPQTQIWRTRVPLFIWQLTRNLSAAGGPTSSQAVLEQYFEFIDQQRGWQQLSYKIIFLSLNRVCYVTTLAYISCQPSNESYTQHHRFHILLQLKNECVNSFSRNAPTYLLLHSAWPLLEPCLLDTTLKQCCTVFSQINQHCVKVADC